MCDFWGLGVCNCSEMEPNGAAEVSTSGLAARRAGGPLRRVGRNFTLALHQDGRGAEEERCGEVYELRARCA